MTFQGTQYTGMPKELRKAKPCAVCQTLFVPNSGVHRYCSQNCKDKNNQQKGSMTAQKQYARISGDWNKYFNRLMRKWRSGLTTMDLLSILEKQKGLCAISGVPLTCTLEIGKRFKTNASIDRIEAGGDYSPYNVQLVCSALNSWRADSDLNEFIWFCKQVTEYQEKIKCPS